MTGRRAPRGRRLLVVLLVVVFMLASGWFGLAGPLRAWLLPPPVPAVELGGSFDLIDHDGRRVSEADYRGRLMLVFFGYTHCPDVCPTKLSVISQAFDLLGDDAEQIAGLFITLDPERDTPAALANYLTHFHPQLVGLGGSREAVDAAAQAYKIRYARHALNDEGDYSIDHPARSFLLDRDGRFLEAFPITMDSLSMAEALRRHLVR